MDLVTNDYPTAVSTVLASRLRALRQDRGWTVKRLAALCRANGAPHLNMEVLYKIERPRTGQAQRTVSVDELYVLATVFQVPIERLLPPSPRVRTVEPADEAALKALVRQVVEEHASYERGGAHDVR